MSARMISVGMLEAAGRRALRLAVLAGVLGGCAAHPPPTEAERITDLATQYTAAWCSHKPSSVASFYTPDGSLTINDGKPAVGRAAISADARRFMTTFPDLKVTMDELTVHGERAVYHWTLSGTNTGPGGTGRHVRISGYEEWRLGADGHIAESRGHFDAADYQRQLTGGAAGS